MKGRCDNHHLLRLDYFGDDPVEGSFGMTPANVLGWMADDHPLTHLEYRESNRAFIESSGTGGIRILVVKGCVA